MSDYYFIKSKLSGKENLVIDILGGSQANGALLDLYPQNTTGTENQLWEFVPDPEGSGYYFIKSKLNGNVIDIQEGNSTAGLQDGTPLDAHSLKSAGSTHEADNQLWQFVEDPAGSGYCFIMSRVNGNVIDVQGASTQPTTALDSFPMKSGFTDNQLWQVVDGSFPKTVSTVAASNLGSNSNYILYGNCNAIINAFVVIDVKQDIVCKSVSPPLPQSCPPSGAENVLGFSFQLNCYSPPGEPIYWQQYGMGFWQNSSGGFNVVCLIDNWTSFDPTSPWGFGPTTLVTLPTAKLPAGYRAVIGLANSAPTSGLTPAVTGAYWELWDNNGKQLGYTSQTIPSTSDGIIPALATPITAFELNIVGPVNGESAVLSSGAGFISYEALEPPLSVLAAEPSVCTETGTITCETANTFYGFLPQGSNLTFKQSFEVLIAKPMLHKEGKPRPATRLSTADLQKILGGVPKS